MRATAILASILLVLPFVLSICSAYLMGGMGPAGTIFAAASTASSPDPKVFTVIVSSIGFNGTASSLNVTVNQGDTVTINFVYGDGGLSFDNPHRVTIEGYALTTGTIDRTTPKQSLTFTVGQAGQFQFHCVQPCFGMENLQQGVLVVRPQCLGGSPIHTGFSPILFDARQPRAVAMSTFLAGENNTPVSGVLVDFSVSTDFGEMLIGHNATSANGMVEFTYTPGSITILDVTVDFAGTCNYEASAATASFQLPTAASSGGQSPFISGQALIDTRLVGVPVILALALIVLGVVVVGSLWSTIGYVFVNTFRLGKGGRDGEDEPGN